MVYFEKSQPAPDCLAIEKAKASGDYKCADVLEKIKNDFKNKCYICENKEPLSINIEHFIPHKGDKDLKFDWNNLFWSCSHCNNIKLDNFVNILNCTDSTHNVDKKLRYFMNPFPCEKVIIEAMEQTPKILETKELLNAVYNGTTKLKTIESANLRNKLLEEISDFQKWLCEYYKATTQSVKDYSQLKIIEHLSRGANFSAFKRWIILDNQMRKDDFEQFFD
ncbi:HNH endonuclease [Flavobacterium sp. FlaQc-28]|uniref:HNH endonuclease n=1 Tax=Flavobacterium sp. FlaQc-28 TaxID=3374178 RepID=UPI0037583268